MILHSIQHSCNPLCSPLVSPNNSLMRLQSFRPSHPPFFVNPYSLSYHPFIPSPLIPPPSISQLLCFPICYSFPSHSSPPHPSPSPHSTHNCVGALFPPKRCGYIEPCHTLVICFHGCCVRRLIFSTFVFGMPYIYYTFA